MTEIGACDILYKAILTLGLEKHAEVARSYGMNPNLCILDSLVDDDSDDSESRRPVWCIQSLARLSSIRGPIPSLDSAIFEQRVKQTFAEIEHFKKVCNLDLPSERDISELRSQMEKKVGVYKDLYESVVWYIGEIGFSIDADNNKIKDKWAQRAPSDFLTGIVKILYDLLHPIYASLADSPPKRNPKSLQFAIALLLQDFLPDVMENNCESIRQAIDNNLRRVE